MAVSREDRTPAAGRRRRRCWPFICWIVLAVVSLPAAGQVGPLQDAHDQLARARALYDALEWESALPVLDALVASLSSRPATEDGLRPLLAAAYELRARSRFGLGNREGARQDLAALVAVDPGYVLPANVAAAVQQMLDEVKRSTVGTLLLTVEPDDASVTIDGAPILHAGGPLPLAAGQHLLSAARGGYRPVEQPVTIVAGAQAPVALTLERIASRVAVLTSPPDVEVSLDGVVRGRTPPGPVPDAYADAAIRLGVPRDQVSAPFYVDDVASGVRLFEFRRPCYVPLDSRRMIERPADLLLEVALEHAAATVKVQSNVANAEVSLNGQPQGQTPLVLSEVCEGPQVLEVSSPMGRFIRRFEAHAGETLDIAAHLAPALALVSAGGEDIRFRGEDVRLVVERLLEPARSITVFEPRREDVADALRDLRLPLDWLAVDRNGRPLGQAAEVSNTLRREASIQLARRFGAQGVAGVSMPGGGDSPAVISLLVAGAADPDVFEVALGAPLPADVLRTLDGAIDVERSSFDLTGVEIADVPGVAVVSVVPGGGAAQAGIGPGDIIVGVRDAPVASTADLQQAIEAITPGQQVPVAVTDRTGATRTVMVAAARRPLLVSIDDRMIRFNKLALDLRFRLAGAPDAIQEGLLRLNLAAALLKLGNPAEARRELQRVTLPDGPGISNGTVQYLLGLSYEATSQPADADRAFRAAAAVEGARVSTFGPLVADLLKARLQR